MSTNLRQQLLEKFKDKEYRDAFVAEQIYSRLPLKIRALREDRDLTQKELGEKAGGMAQAWVSKLEDPNYGKLTISTLLKVASACDVALNVDFVPYSHILDQSTNLNRESFSVPSYDQDAALWSEEAPTMNEIVANLTPTFGKWPTFEEGSPLYLQVAKQHNTIIQPTFTATEYTDLLMQTYESWAQPSVGVPLANLLRLGIPETKFIFTELSKAA